MATYYVTQAGGETIESATAKSITEFNANTGGFVAAGNTIYLVGTITTQVAIPASGTAGSPIVLRGDYSGGAGTVTVAASNGIACTSKNYIELYNITVANCALIGIYVYNVCAGWVIDGCTVTKCQKGIYIEGPASGTSFSENHSLIDCVSSGHQYSGFHALQLIRNVTYTNCKADGNGTAAGAHGFSAGPNRNNIVTGATNPGGTVFKSASAIGYTVTHVANLTDDTAYLTENPGAEATVGSGEWDQDGSGYVYFNIGEAIAGKVIYCFSSGAENIKYVKCEAMNTVAFGGTEGAGFQADDHCTSATYVGCVAHDNDTQGFHSNGGLSIKYHGCVSYNNGTSGFHGYNGPLNAEWVNCTAFDNGGNGFYLGQTAGFVGTVTNCISDDNTQYGITAAGAATLVLNYNNWYGNGTGAESVPAGTTKTPATQWTYDPQLGADFSVGNALLKGTGLWVAGVRAYDDLPLPLRPDIGAVQDRTAAGRRFGVGGGVL